MTEEHAVKIIEHIYGTTCIIQNFTQLQMSPLRSGVTESTSMIESSTPPSSPSLSVPKGHRRNMSDTTAFNK